MVARQVQAVLVAGRLLPKGDCNCMLSSPRYASFLLSFTLSFSPLLAFGQSTEPSPPVGDPLLRIEGEVEHALALTGADLLKLSHQTVQTKDHDGAEATFVGVALVDLLRLAGVKLGEQLRGKQMTAYLLVKAADGYQVVFALPEFDPGFTDRVILLADQRDGKPLSAAEGPLRIIVPSEKRQARWVRQVTSLTILRAGSE